MKPESFDAVAYKNSYTNEHYDRFSLILPKGSKRELQAIAARQNQSMNAVITTALTDMINKEQQKRMRRLLHYKENLRIPQEFKVLFGTHHLINWIFMRMRGISSRDCIC